MVRTQRALHSGCFTRTPVWTLHAVALAGELPDLYMREGPLPVVLEWLTYAAARLLRARGLGTLGRRRSDLHGEMDARTARRLAPMVATLLERPRSRAEGDIHRRYRTTQKPVTRTTQRGLRKTRCAAMDRSRPVWPHHRFARWCGRSGLKLKPRLPPYVAFATLNGETGC